MMIRASIANFSVLAIWLALSGDAFAQDCPRASSPDQARQLAGEAFSQGQTLFEAGNYQAALGRFRCSYSIVPHHNTLYNMGECAEALENWDDAIRYFQTYVETYPDMEGQAEAEARLRELQTRRTASVPPPDDGRGSEEQPTTRMTLARKLAWITLGVGAGLTIVGGGVFGGAVAQNGAFEEANRNYLQGDNLLDSDERSDLESMRDSGEAMEGAGWALMGIGLASVAASLVLFFVFDANEPIPGAANAARRLGLGVSPLVLEDGGGLFVAGRF